MGVAFRELPGGRSRWRLPQSRDRAQVGSTHCGYCIHGSHLLPMITITQMLAHPRGGTQGAVQVLSLTGCLNGSGPDVRCRGLSS